MGSMMCIKFAFVNNIQGVQYFSLEKYRIVECFDFIDQLLSRAIDLPLASHLELV